VFSILEWVTVSKRLSRKLGSFRYGEEMAHKSLDIFHYKPLTLLSKINSVKSSASMTAAQREQSMLLDRFFLVLVLGPAA